MEAQQGWSCMQRARGLIAAGAYMAAGPDIPRTRRLWRAAAHPLAWIITTTAPRLSSCDRASTINAARLTRPADGCTPRRHRHTGLHIQMKVLGPGRYGTDIVRYFQASSTPRCSREQRVFCASLGGPCPMGASSIMTLNCKEARKSSHVFRAVDTLTIAPGSGAV